MEKGLLVFVYKSNDGDATNNGVSNRHEKFVLIGPGVSGPFEPNEDTPALYLDMKHFNRFGKHRVVSDLEEGNQQFGGNFIFTTDSRFSGINNGSPIKIHDRFEFSKYKVEFMYTDASNYKDHYCIEIDKNIVENNKLKIGTEITMGTYGTLSLEEFFGSEFHKDSYDANFDHNILEIVQITKKYE
jgi:hypothetical protein